MEESEFGQERAAERAFERIEEHIQGNEELLALARRTAGLLANCPPEKRAIILQEAQSLWDTQRGPQSAESESLQSAETFLDVTSAWMTAILNDLPPGIRIEVLQILSQLKENARFDRLAIDVDLGAGE